MTPTAKEIHEHMQRIGTWVDWERTCDGFKYGDPDAPVEGIAVGWQSLQSALEEAHDKGCNLFITHEPTFYSHMDDDEDWRATLPARHKMDFLSETGMVVYRCHDVWDRYPELGIVDSWSAFLELGEPVATTPYYNLHDLPSLTVWELAQRLARRLRPLDQQAVQLYGTKWQMVSRLAVGTGAITNVRHMVDMGADVLLTTDDGTTLWRDAAWLADLGVPMIKVNHMTAEVPGLRNLVAYLQKQFPDVPVEWVGPTCQYEIFATETHHDIPIRMRRDTLDDVPPVAVSDRYEVRPMAADEAWAYLQVMNRSIYAGQADEAWFKKTFSGDPAYDPSYLQIIWKGEEPVAVAGAWHRTIDDEEWGMIHFVGVVGTERGEGLGKAVVLAALHRLRERGFEHAMLDTQDWRLPAVAAYLRLGFRPWPTEKGTREVWDRVLEDLATWRKWGRPRPR